MYVCDHKWFLLTNTLGKREEGGWWWMKRYSYPACGNTKENSTIIQQTFDFTRFMQCFHIILIIISTSEHY